MLIEDVERNVFYNPAHGAARCLDSPVSTFNDWAITRKIVNNVMEVSNLANYVAGELPVTTVPANSTFVDDGTGHGVHTAGFGSIMTFVNADLISGKLTVGQSANALVLGTYIGSGTYNGHPYLQFSVDCQGAQPTYCTPTNTGNSANIGYGRQDPTAPNGYYNDNIVLPMTKWAATTAARFGAHAGHGSITTGTGPGQGWIVEGNYVGTIANHTYIIWGIDVPAITTSDYSSATTSAGTTTFNAATTFPPYVKGTSFRAADAGGNSSYNGIFTVVTSSPSVITATSAVTAPSGASIGGTVASGGANQASCAVPATFSGNINMTNGSAIDSWTPNAGTTTGC